jgi:hypothetical protein
MPGHPRGEDQEIRVKGRMAKLLRGELSVEDLDDEELARGYCKAKDGTFRGKPPGIIPRAMWTRMQRELFQRFDERLKSNLVETLDVVLELAKDRDIDAGTRLRAAQYVIDRTMGKTPEKITVSHEDPWETIINDVMREGIAETTRTLVRKKVERDAAGA